MTNYPQGYQDSESHEEKNLIPYTSLALSAKHHMTLNKRPKPLSFLEEKIEKSLPKGMPSYISLCNKRNDRYIVYHQNLKLFNLIGHHQESER